MSGYLSPQKKKKERKKFIHTRKKILNVHLKMNLRFKGLLKQNPSSIVEQYSLKKKRKNIKIRSNVWSSRFLHLLRKKQKPSPIFNICINKSTHTCKNIVFMYKIHIYIHTNWFIHTHIHKCVDIKHLSFPFKNTL